MSRRDPVRDAGAGPSDYTDLFDWRRAYQSGGGFDSLPRPGTVSFVLTGPEAKAPFLAESREALAKLGFQGQDARQPQPQERRGHLPHAHRRRDAQGADDGQLPHPTRENAVPRAWP